jgi:endonuclease/exonuclease/phosphatase family metal-dependent hydrolase
MADPSYEMTQHKYGPQFPAADYHSIRQGGAKNHRVNIGCGEILISTYNVRSLMSEDRLLELEEELSKVKWHVVGLSEVRRKGESLQQLTSRNMLYTRGTDKGGSSGVGFLVHKDLAGMVTDYKSTTDRVAMIVIKLNSKYSVKIIQAYMPTTGHDDKELEAVYEEINELMDGCRTHYTMVMGDFNAKIGLQQRNEQGVMGKHGIGQRNERGDRLIEFAASRNLYIANTRFKKKSKWTWKSPDGKTTNEIDFIMTDHINTVKDVTVLNRVDVGSDHRMVRSKISFPLKLERKKLTASGHKNINLDKLNEMKQEFQLQLRNKFQILNDEVDTYQDFTKAITEAAYEVAGTKKRSKVDKISQETRAMLEQRRLAKTKLTNHGKVEYVELCKTIRKRMREEIRRYNVNMVEKAIREHKKIMRNNGRQLMVAIKDDNGNLITDRVKIVQRCADFYKKLYSSTKARPTATSSNNTEAAPEVTINEVENALKYMNHGKAPGPDGVVTEILQQGGSVLWKKLAALFSKCLTTKTVPEEWNNGFIILLHKKGDIKDINNYRPISLLSHTGKLFSKIVLRRIEATLDISQPREQAGFRKGYSTTDHLQVITQVIEKTNEYEIPLCLGFVDYEKAFDSVEHIEIMKAINSQGVNMEYVKLLTNIYNKGQASIKLDTESEKFPLQRGVRQGDIISPKLFNAGLEEVFKRLDWENNGLRINGEYLSHLRFADDIVLISRNPRELQSMISELNDESSKLGMKMNMKKTKAMFNRFTDRTQIHVNGTTIETVDSYIYLGQLVTMQNDKSEEIKRRTVAAWMAFNKHRDIMKSKIPMCLKRKVYNQCVLATMIYGSQTWATTKKMQEKLRVTQRSMERAMVGVTRKDKKTNAWLRLQTGVEDIVRKVKKLKWQWAGHVARMNDNRWTKIVTEWIPIDKKRKPGRPTTRWEDEIANHLGVTWMREASNRKQWCQHGEAFIQQWI